MTKNLSYIFSGILLYGLCFGVCFVIVSYSNSVAVAVPEKVIFTDLKEEEYIPPVEPEEPAEPEVVETETEPETEIFPEEEIVEPIQEEVYFDEPVYQEECIYYDEPVYYEEPTQSVSIGNDFQSDGRWNDGTYDYTWYSSNVLHHYRTSEWTAGEDGIYRDADGYVVVASSDLDQGTVVEDTPFGAAKVYDSGCASGTLDVYVNW